MDAMFVVVHHLVWLTALHCQVLSNDYAFTAFSYMWFRCGNVNWE